jgi:hypothetical protein
VALAVAMPLSTNAATMGGKPWGGSWSSTCLYKLSLKQSGNTVKGSAGYYAAQMKGTVKGNKWIGAWKAPGAPWKAGTFVFVLASNNKSFAGTIKPAHHKAMKCSAKKN